MNADNAIRVLNKQPKAAHRYHQFGATLGGPVRADRLFYFVNYDGQRHKDSNDVFLNLPTSTPSDEATRAGIARLLPLAFPWNRTLDQDLFLVKFDQQLTAAQRLTIRYNHQNFTG